MVSSCVPHSVPGRSIHDSSLIVCNSKIGSIIWPFCMKFLAGLQISPCCGARMLSLHLRLYIPACPSSQMASSCNKGNTWRLSIYRTMLECSFLQNCIIFASTYCCLSSFSPRNFPCFEPDLPFSAWLLILCLLVRSWLLAISTNQMAPFSPDLCWSPGSLLSFLPSLLPLLGPLSSHRTSSSNSSYP